MKQGIVLFAHGSGSSRHSSRNKFVAEELRRGELGTLLLDLLTPQEEQVDMRTGQLRFDIGLLADRLIGAIRWLDTHDETRALPPGPRKKVERRMRVYFDLVRDTLAELKAAGRLRDIDVTVGAFGVLGLILWIPRWFREGGRLSNEQVADNVASLALPNIR